MQHEHQSNEETVDLTATFPPKLQDGEHQIYSSDQLNLLALVHGGKVTWRATDNHGHDLKCSTGVSSDTRCWVCIDINPRTGRCRLRGFVPCWTLEK
jgi:hypothetical protein